jgi:hypothetical protein
LRFACIAAAAAAAASAAAAAVAHVVFVHDMHFVYSISHTLCFNSPATTTTLFCFGTTAPPLSF